MRWYRRIALPLALVLAMTWSGALYGQADQRCFAETGFCVAGRFREVWERNGGLVVFGYPISPQREEFVEGRLLQVQWFERQRIELHPESLPPFDIQIGRVGAELLALQGRDWFSFPRSSPAPGCRYFPSVQHNVCGPFLEAWRSYGIEVDGRRGISDADSLTLFGLPLSDEMSEQIDGQKYTVQWFERARLELDPENPRSLTVTFGRLGSELQARVPTLPSQHLQRMIEAAEREDLLDEPPARRENLPFILAPERILIYALRAQSGPSRGIGMILMPRSRFLEVPPEAVVACAPQVTNRILGGLSVIQQVNRLPVGDYVLALEPGCRTLTLYGEGSPIRLDATLRLIDLKESQREMLAGGGDLAALRAQLPVPAPPRQLTQPTGLISALQICQFVTAENNVIAAVCGHLYTPADRSIREQIEEAARQFGADDVNSFFAVPDVVGSVAEERCAKELANGEPPYPDCTPSLLAAAKENTASRDEDGVRIRPLGVIVALESIVDNIFADPALTRPVPELTAGPYLAQDLRLRDDPEVAPNVFWSRLRLDGPPGRPDTFFAPAYSNLPLLPIPPEEPAQAAIVGLHIVISCWAECD